MVEYPHATWRLIHSAPADGATQMAMDEAILRAVSCGESPPTLRFYAWDPGCLSLGRGQPVADVDLEALVASGFDLVRRPTGGRAILHVDELTYAVVAPDDDPRVAGGVVESYRRLSAGLIRGLERLGVTGIVSDERAASRRAKGPVCFEVPSDYEIAVDGRKLVGSAQMRARGAVLQHGAVPLTGDIARICPLLAALPGRNRVRARAATLEDVLGKPVSWSDVADALAEGFAEALTLELKPAELSNGERLWTESLREKKYATDDWNRKV